MNDFPTHTMFFSLAMFVLLIIIFHIYVYIAKPNARFLKKVDYWWLAFSSLSLFGAVYAQKQLYADNIISRSNLTTKSDINLLKKEISFQRNYVCNTPWVEPKFPDPDAITRYKTRNEACEWFKKLDENANKEGITFQDVIDVAGEPVPEKLSQWENNEINELVIISKKQINENGNIHSEFNRSFPEEIIIFIFPYILVFALALRITKVTGELRIQK